MKFYLIPVIILFPFVLQAQKGLNILASTSWTAAYAKAAGVQNIEQLAPSSLEHPSEYELQIGDIEKIKKADFIVYAGYETVISQIRQSLKIDQNKFIKIETSYIESQIRAEVIKIAEKTNTLEKAELSLGSIRQLFSKAKAEIEKNGMKGQPVITHFFQEGFAIEIGLDPVAVFGPAPLESYNLSELAKKDVVLIIDNLHNPIAQPLSEIKKGTRTVELLNFPGLFNTVTIEDVIRYNMMQVLGSERWKNGKVE
jgi:zinc transport system substrate-binding protein